MESVNLTRVVEWRELRITLGEGGAPAQRKLIGVEFLRDAEGNNVAEKPTERALSAEEAVEYCNSTAFATADACDAAHVRIAELTTELGRTNTVVAAQTKLIEKYDVLETSWNDSIAPAINEFRQTIAALSGE